MLHIQPATPQAYRAVYELNRPPFGRAWQAGTIAVELVPDALEIVPGLVIYPPEFMECAAEAEQP
ncbi:MAG: hypothetical protein ACYC6L_14405 [Anaerolineae bacterium]